jgi:hypothetical protein
MFPSNSSLIPLSFIALLAGLIFEHRRLSNNWSTVIYSLLGALGISLFAFLKFKEEGYYDLYQHLRVWPYAFIGAFVVIGIILNYEKLNPQLTEGITLIQSIAIIYWTIDVGILNLNYLIVKMAVGVGTVFCLFSFFHAFSYSPLSRPNRLMLSIWSTIIMIFFAADFLYDVYQNKPIEYMATQYEALYASLQYFLLGVSIMYIMQNCTMILGFLPAKGTFFNAEYFRGVNELKSYHVARYEDEQVHVGHSIVCLVFCVAIFGLNYYFAFVPRNIAIWATFVSFPLALSLLVGARRF